MGPKREFGAKLRKFKKLPISPASYVSNDTPDRDIVSLRRTSMTIKAVVFDLGGVCVGSPLHAINEYEKILGVPHNFFNYMIAHWKSPSPMNRLELGEWDTISPEFLKLFHEHLNDAEGYHAFFSSPFCPKDAVEGRPPTVDGMELWRRMIEASSVVNTELIKVIQQLRASGKYKVWALTNNFPGDFGAPVVALFDRVVGSVQMKMRKPDPRLYKYLIKELDLPSEEIVGPPPYPVHESSTDRN